MATSAFGSISPEIYREGMSRLAGAVNIVTTDGPGGRAGFTASAVCSVTDNPPTLLVCVNEHGSAGAAFSRNQAIAVNTLSAEQEPLARTFGGQTPMAERFDAVNWRIGRSGAPLLQLSLVSFDCQVESSIVQGTHRVLFCRVIDVDTGPTAGASIYFSRRFHCLNA